MNSRGSKAILILVVSLTAFSSAMKELNEVRQFGLQLNQFVAEWSEQLAPADIPAPVMAIEEPQAPPPVAEPIRSCKAETVKVKKTQRLDIDPVQFEVKTFSDRDVPAVFEFQQPGSSFKFKTHKQSFFRISPRDREMLKSLNRSISLRIAS
jgi:hypothetical protein